MKALGMYVFAGSFSIAVMNSLFDIDKVLEITDDMLEQNAKHFITNYPTIPVIKPSEWDNDNYIEKLKRENYDFVYGNPPCSGLSQINRNASVDSDTNKHMYKFIDTVYAVTPKTFLMENAPTLISKGKKILDYLVKTLGYKYYLIVLRDYAANHRVSMKRQRTMIFGFRQDCFLGIPQIRYESDRVDASEILMSYDKNILENCELVPERTCKDLEKYYDKAIPGKSIMMSLAQLPEAKIKRLDLTEKRIHQILDYKYKLLFGKRIYDKSPNKISPTGPAPSLTSVTELIHPIYDRPLYVREYAKLMGYPDEFKFSEEAKVPIVQSIAQGVPVKFAQWAATNIYEILNGNIQEFEFRVGTNLQPESIMFVNVCNYHNIFRRFFTIEEFLETDNICK